MTFVVIVVFDVCVTLVDSELLLSGWCSPGKRLEEEKPKKIIQTLLAFSQIVIRTKREQSRARIHCRNSYFVVPIESTHFPPHTHIYIKVKADFNKYIGHNYTHTFVHATFIPLTFTHLQKKKKKINISSHFCLCCFRCFLHIYARNVFHSERGTKSKIKRISNIYKCIFWKNIYLLCTYYTYI